MQLFTIFLCRYYRPHDRSTHWYSLIDAGGLPSIFPSQVSYLPVSTEQITYPYIFEKTTCPVKPTTTVAWTKKERSKAMKAAVMSTLQALKHEVSFISCHII